MEPDVRLWFTDKLDQFACHKEAIMVSRIDGPEDVADITIEDDQIIYNIGVGRKFLAIRAISACPIFASARLAGLRGTVRLWLDDQPRGFGLAFSGGPDAILIPDTTFILSGGYQSLREVSYLPWVERNQTIFWRGYATGFPQEPWYASPRAAMCLAVRDDPKFDVGLVGRDDPTPIIEARIARIKVELTEFANYRHVIDIDGNSTSWSGLFSRLLFGCTVLKLVSDQRQWYYDRFLPWVHYVPVGSINELRSMGELALINEVDCERIAAAGQELARSITWESAINDGVEAVAKCLRLAPSS